MRPSPKEKSTGKQKGSLGKRYGGHWIYHSAEETHAEDPQCSQIQCLADVISSGAGMEKDLVGNMMRLLTFKRRQMQRSDTTYKLSRANSLFGT